MLFWSDKKNTHKKKPARKAEKIKNKGDTMKRNLVVISLTFCMVFGSAMTSMGSGFRALGNRSISMGGAGVAYSSGSYAAYFNPALLSSHEYGMEIDVSAGAGFREDNVADHLDTLSEIDIDETLDALSNMAYPDIGSIDPDIALSGSGLMDETLRGDLLTIQNELLAMSERNSLELMPSGAVAMQFRNFGFGVYGLSDISATAVIDDERLGIIVPVEQGGTTYYVEYNPEDDVFTRRDQEYYNDYSMEQAIEMQTTTVMLTGVAYMEIPIAYAYRIKTSFGDLSFGGAFKIMSGNTYKLDKPIDTESGDISDDIEDYEKKNTTFGVDAGVLLNPLGMDKLSLGLAAKNINSPEFDFIDGTTLEFDPQVRAGIAYSFLLNRLIFAMDVDLTSNDSLVSGYEERYIGGGVDFRPVSWFSIRGGLMKNMEDSGEGTVLTAGLGFGAKWFQFDVAGQYATEEGTYDGDDYPKYGRIQASFVSRWF